MAFRELGSKWLGTALGCLEQPLRPAPRSAAGLPTVVAHESAFNNDLSAQINAITQSFVPAGASVYDANHCVYFMLYRSLLKQSATLAYIDTTWLFFAAAILMVPLAFLMHPRKPDLVSMGHQTRRSQLAIRSDTRSNPL